MLREFAWHFFDHLNYFLYICNMAVSWYYIFFLTMVIILSGVIMSKQYDYKPKNKNVELLVDLFLYFVFGISTSFLLFNGEVKWWSLLLSLVIGVIISFILAAVLNRETRLYDDTTEYKQDNLIGKCGEIVEYLGDNIYLGKLQDEMQTPIKVIIDDTIYYDEGDKFEITEITQKGIFAVKI